MKVLALTKYTAAGPSSRYRLYQFQPFLEKRGVDVDVQALHDEGYLQRRYAGRGRESPLYLARRFADRLRALSRAKRYDLVFVQKELFPYLPALAERALNVSRIPYVVDIDDAIFLFYRGRRLLEGKIPRVISGAALVLAGNRYLESYAQRFSGNVVHFPTVVDTDRFTPGESARTVPVVGWIGSPETVGYLDAIVSPLARSPAQFQLFVVGAPAPHIGGVDARAKAWSEAEEADDLRAMDVGIMPLRDDEWSRGKCSLKLLQYMSAGLASVSSPVGSVGEIIKDGNNGFLAGDDGAWSARVAQLVEDAPLRQRVGASARRWVVANYSLANYGPRMADVLFAAAEGRKPE